MEELKVNAADQAQVGGFKFQTPRGILLTTNALFPLRNSGMQPSVVWTGGLEYNF